jgi:hypothetical protein
MAYRDWNGAAPRHTLRLDPERSVSSDRASDHRQSIG